MVLTHIASQHCICRNVIRINFKNVKDRTKNFVKIFGERRRSEASILFKEISRKFRISYHS